MLKVLALSTLVQVNTHALADTTIMNISAVQTVPFYIVQACVVSCSCIMMIMFRCRFESPVNTKLQYIQLSLTAKDIAAGCLFLLLCAQTCMQAPLLLLTSLHLYICTAYCIYTVHSGVAAVGDKLLLGPDRFGSFKRVTVTSIHVSRRAVTAVAAGRTATFTLKSHTRHSSGDSCSGSSSSSDELPISSAVYTATTVATSMADSSSSSDDASTDVFGAIDDFTNPVCATSSLDIAFSGTLSNGAAAAAEPQQQVNSSGSSNGATTTVSARAKRRAKQLLASCSSAPGLTAHSSLLQSSTSTATTAAATLIDDDVAELFVKEENSPRKGGPGLVLLHDSYAPTASFEFSAEVVVLHHPSAIYARYA
jgi:hypothetical protein